MQYSITFDSLHEAANDGTSGTVVNQIVPDNAVKFGDPGLNRYREIRPKSSTGQTALEL